MFAIPPQLIQCGSIAHRLFSTLPEVDVLAQPDYWALHEPAVWDAPDLKLTIPAGFKTDFASIPGLLKGIMDVDGLSRPAALLHDALYTWQVTTRAQADQQLRRALIAYGEPSDIARVYWLGVRIGGWKAWDAHSAHPLGADNFESAALYQQYIADGRKFLTFENLL